MENPQTSTLAMHAVSRSRGKQPGESVYTTRLRERRKAKGQAKSSDESESDDEIEPGAVVLHKMFNRQVILHPDNTVVKSGKRIPIGEAEALRVAAQAGIPAPFAICGSSPHLIGSCDGTEIRDTRLHFTYHSPPCRDEQAFNEFLLSALYKHIPQLVREAFSRRLKTNHRIILSHCDLTPRNILVHDGKIKGLVDWEDSGWYPEYWEYVKFFQRTADKDWKQYAADIFPELYHDELVDFIAMSKWQNS
ncbi:hypothetical protein HYQ46_007872 [Verticillium longisporum]|nr:hypothetical protein HYQ46_007872 [Verticillium longisporum]